MKQYFGKTVSGRISIGKLKYHEKTQTLVEKRLVADVELEIERLREAVKISLVQLDELYQKVYLEAGEYHASVFMGHRMILLDEHYVGEIENSIRQDHVNVEYAIEQLSKAWVMKFEAMETAYMRARAADINDISQRLRENLDGEKNNESWPKEPAIIFANDLTPSETVRMNVSNVLGFITKHGSTYSHTSILARTLGIPAIVDISIEAILDGELAILDGESGQVIVSPTKEMLEVMQTKLELQKEEELLLKTYQKQEAITMDGVSIQIFANIGNIDDAMEAIKNGAQGIGLFRTELLFLGRNDFPSEEEQYLTFCSVANKMKNKKFIIRTMDIGADKQLDYLNLGNEENPALGFRGIRICLEYPKLLKDQLAAGFRAAYHYPIQIMFPMIVSIREIEQIQEIVNQVVEDLDTRNVDYKKPPLGIMIETPAAMLISDELARKVDFFSIGTNDLMQYLNAADRQNPRTEYLYDFKSDVFKRSIQMIVKSAKDAGIDVSICGEAAGDPELTEFFLKEGIHELSVDPKRILKIVKRVREINLKS